MILRCYVARQETGRRFYSSLWAKDALTRELSDARQARGLSVIGMSDFP